MKTYTKRIAFLVSYQTLVPHGGIGQFTKSFIEMMHADNIKVDIITDKQPKDSEFIAAIKSAGANFIYPDESLPYVTHSNIFMYGDSFCYERMANFRNAIVKALSNNLYDVMICNTYETVQVAQTMGLEDVIQIIAYTHLESQIFTDTTNPFLDSVNSLMRSQLTSDKITVGTQSTFNKMALNSSNSFVTPIPFTELGLLNRYPDKKREGVLFIGRWEEGKNPELYLELIEKTKLPARVMTNVNGAKKFEARLKAMGVDYKIAVSIIGQEKVDFITSCRVAFNPSTVESYGLAFLEQISQLPTVSLDTPRWINNFNDNLYTTTDKKSMVDKVMHLYETFSEPNHYYDTGFHDQVIYEDSHCFSLWAECFNSFTPKKSNSNTAKILQKETVVYADYIKDLKRSIICIDDIRSVLTNRHKYTTIYTDDHTILSKDPNYVPVVTVNPMANLFEFE